MTELEGDRQLRCVHRGPLELDTSDYRYLLFPWTLCLAFLSSSGDKWHSVSLVPSHSRFQVEALVFGTIYRLEVACSEYFKFPTRRE